MVKLRTTDGVGSHNHLSAPVSADIHLTSLVPADTLTHLQPADNHSDQHSPASAAQHQCGELPCHLKTYEGEAKGVAEVGAPSKGQPIPGTQPPATKFETCKESVCLSGRVSHEKVDQCFNEKGTFEGATSSSSTWLSSEALCSFFCCRREPREEEDEPPSERGPSSRTVDALSRRRGPLYQTHMFHPLFLLSRQGESSHNLMLPS